MKNPRTELFPAPASPRHTTGDETRSRLLAAATDVFLEDGFRAARVQEIARRAGLRLSAINYHFEGKEGLYLAVLRHHADAALATTPLMAPGTEQPLRARFDFAVQALVNRILDTHSKSRIGALMLRELVNPTPALDVLITQFNAPQAAVFMGLLREVLGPTVPAETLARSLISIFGQCAIYILGRPMITRLMPHAYEGDAVQDRITRHITEFSWAGLMALRQQWEKQDAPA